MGADVLYAPGVTRKEEIAALVKAVDRPVNVLMGLPGVELSMKELSAMGVRRVERGERFGPRCLWSLFASGPRSRRHEGRSRFCGGRGELSRDKQAVPAVMAWAIGLFVPLEVRGRGIIHLVITGQA